MCTYKIAKHKTDVQLLHRLTRTKVQNNFIFRSPPNIRIPFGINILFLYIYIHNLDGVRSTAIRDELTIILNKYTQAMYI